MRSCKQCGAHLTDKAAFCPQCGTPVDGAPTREMSEDGALATPQAAVENAGKPSGKRPRKRGAIIAAAVAVVVVVAGVGAGIWWKTDQDAKAAAQMEWERTHVSLVTQVPIEAPGFDASSTAIPVQVQGTDLDGNEVDELQFLRPGATHVETLAGTYNLVFPGGYFTGAGQVMRAPAAPVHIEVKVPSGDAGSADASGEADGEARGEADAGASDDENVVAAEEDSDSSATDTSGGESAEADSSGSAASDAAATASGAAADSASDASAAAKSEADTQQDSAESASGAADTAAEATAQVATFTEVPPLEVTDELIADISKWTGQDPEDSGKAQALSQTAMKAHSDAVAAEEARKAAEAEAARKAAELNEAYAANPRTIQGGVNGIVQSTAPINLTGTIEVRQGNGIDSKTHAVTMQDVVLLVLPADISVTGTPYEEVATNNCIELCSYATGNLSDIKAMAGRTVTLNLSLFVNTTSKWVNSRYTYIEGSIRSLVRTFD